MTDPKIQIVDADELADFLDPAQPAMLVILISREHIEQRATHSTLDRLLRLSNAESHFRAAAKQCEIMVSGYDDDSRELHEIPEVRQFFGHLATRWPYFWHFATDEARRLVHFLMLEFEPVDTPAGRAYRLPPPAAVQAYCQSMIQGTFELYARHRHPPQSAKRLVDAVIDELIPR